MPVAAAAVVTLPILALISLEPAATCWMLRAISRVASPCWSIEVEIEEELPELVCRTQQLQQILMNLITNARDALNRRRPERNDAKTIRVRVQKLLSRAGWVRFEVADNGDGFDIAIADRLFDPFFTTKPVGEGTGLGLSISDGIARAHGGTMSCERHGAWTSFRVELPCTPPDLDSAPRPLDPRARS